MKLLELFQAVKDHQLTKDQLEMYRNELAHVFADMKIEYAELEKNEAIYLLQQKDVAWTGRKAMWKGTDEGQRMITLKNYLGATNKILDSLKSRLYSIY